MLRASRLASLLSSPTKDIIPISPFIPNETSPRQGLENSPSTSMNYIKHYVSTSPNLKNDIKFPPMLVDHRRQTSRSAVRHTSKPSSSILLVPPRNSPRRMLDRIPSSVKLVPTRLSFAYWTACVL